MANNWKYADLGERERLKLIRGGNAEVYNTEKERNKQLRDRQYELGLSTKYVDEWDKTIDNAYSSGIAKRAEGENVKYMSRVLSAVNNAYSKAIKTLREERDKALGDANVQAEGARENLSEWLTNNGFSDEGSTSKKEREELEEEIEALVKQIKAQYKAKEEKTRSDYFSPFLR